MEGEISNVTAPIENLLLMIPGASTPVGRAVVFGSLGGAIAYYARPSMSFKPDGTPKAWIFTDSADPDATLFPYWAYVAVPGFIFSVLI
jgi:hypothetical protein